MAPPRELKFLSLEVVLKELNDSKRIWWHRYDLLGVVEAVYSETEPATYLSSLAREYTRYRIYRMCVESSVVPIDVK